MESFPNISELDADGSDSVENWEEIKNLKAFSSIDFTNELLKEGPFELEIEEVGEDKFVKTLINEEKLLAFVESQKDRFNEDEKKLELMGEKTELSLTPELSERVKEMLSQVEGIAENAGLFSKRFLERKGEFKLKAEVIDSDRSFQGWFMCQEMIEFSEEEEKVSELRIGLKGIKTFASGLRMSAVGAGIELNEDDSLLLALFGTIGHEYGHYMEHVVSSGPNLTRDQRLDEKAASISPLDIKLDDSRTERGIVSERLAQGVASLALERKIESMDVPSDKRDELKRLALDTDPSEVEKYQVMVDWAKERGLSVKHLQHVLVDIHLFLKGKGLEKESQRCMTRLNSLGYYTEPYTQGDLKAIVNSVK